MRRRTPEQIPAWRVRWFEPLSHVPGTREWRIYRETEAWIRNVVAFVERTLPPGESFPFPFPVPRNPAALEFAVQAELALLEAMDAADRGGDALVVLSEHMPDLPWPDEAGTVSAW